MIRTPHDSIRYDRFMQLTNHQRRPRLELENPPRPDNLPALYRDTEDSFEQSQGMLKDWIRRISYESRLRQEIMLRAQYPSDYRSSQ